MREWLFLVMEEFDLFTLWGSSQRQGLGWLVIKCLHVIFIKGAAYMY